MTQPYLLILTGPPGAGKTTIYNTHHRHLPLVDIDQYSGSHEERLQQRKASFKELLEAGESFVLTTAAPEIKQKEWWFKQGRSSGFHTILVALIPPLMVAYERHKARGHHDNLPRSIQRWYRHYRRHPRELVVDGDDIRAGYERIVLEHGAPISAS